MDFTHRPESNKLMERTSSLHEGTDGDKAAADTFKVITEISDLLNTGKTFYYGFILFM